MFKKILNKLNKWLPIMILTMALYNFFLSKIVFFNTDIINAFYYLFTSILFLIIYIIFRLDNLNINVETKIIHEGESNDKQL
jgi:hypothetical protein